MFLVAIAGPLGSGKSTLARFISASFSDPKIIPFAYPLKKAAVDLGWDGKKDEKGRKLLQLLGTECGRECIDTDIWVKKWEESRSEAKGEGCNIVLADDMRFPNEMIHIQACRGVTIYLEGRHSYDTEEQMKHPSETALLNIDLGFDFLFDNSGPLDDMQTFAKTVVDYLYV